jgi:putative hydrolase of the HAD superfamily
VSDRPAPPQVPPIAVVFDLFHTLVDPEEFRPPTFLRGPYLAERLGLERERFVEFWRQSYVDRARSRRPSVGERVLQYCASVGKEISEERLASAIRGAGQYQDVALEQPRPEILASLRSIRRRGIRTGLLSNCDEMEVRRWGSSPLADCFDFVGLSCDLGHVKPEPEAYEAVLRGLGNVPADRCAFIGDGSSDEFSGARSAGIGRVIFMRGFVGHNGMRTPTELGRLADQADATVDHLPELESLLSGEFSSPGLGRSPRERRERPGRAPS